MSNTQTILITALATALVLWVAVRQFFFNRIKKLSDQIKSQRKSQYSIPTTQYPLKELEQQVKDWSAERKEEIEQLEKLENYRKEFLGNVSHELKTPIFNIQGYMATLLDGGLEDKTVNRDYLQRGMKSVDRMIAIVEDLQTITQLEKGELEI